MGNILTFREFYEPLKDKYTERLSRYGAQAGQMAEVFTQMQLGDTFAKGLSSTGIIAGDGTSGGDALKLQDIGQQLAVTELRMKNNAPFWNLLPKVPAYSDVIELTRLDKWNAPRRLGFLNETASDGGLLAKDPTITRKTTPVKWAGGRYQVSRTVLHQRTLGINMDPLVGNAEEVSSISRLEGLVLNLNEMCWWGDNTMNSHEPNGVIQQIRAANTYSRPTRINLGGEALTPTLMSDIEQKLRSKGAIWTDFFWGNEAYSDMRKQLINFMRTGAGQAVPLGNYADEYLVTSWGGQVGRSRFHQDLFLDPPSVDDTFPADTGAPTRPTTTAATAATQSTNNVWGSKLIAGTYTYSACAVGVNGRSNVRVDGSSVSPDGTQLVNVVITNASADTLFFEVYRGDSSGTRKYLGRVNAESVAVSATATFVDDGEFLPGCSTAVALCLNQGGAGIAGAGDAEILVRQLFPISKIVLPINIMSIEAAWITAFTPQVLKPGFQMVIENIGRLTG